MKVGGEVQWGRDGVRIERMIIWGLFKEWSDEGNRSVLILCSTTLSHLVRASRTCI